MTVQEALRIMDAQDDDDLLDLYEEKLFSIKQYLTSKPLVSKLFKVQIEKLMRLNDAAQALRLDPIDAVEMRSHFDFNADSDIMSTFLEFERVRALYKTEIMKSTSAFSMVSLTKMVLEVQKHYFELWPDYHDDDKNEILIGKEADPMEIVADLRRGREIGIKEFKDLHKQPIETLVTLRNEWKRVSLLRQKESEWKTSSEN